MGSFASAGWTDILMAEHPSATIEQQSDKKSDTFVVKIPKPGVEEPEIEEPEIDTDMIYQFADVEEFDKEFKPVLPTLKNLDYKGKFFCFVEAYKIRVFTDAKLANYTSILRMNQRRLQNNPELYRFFENTGK